MSGTAKPGRSVVISSLQDLQEAVLREAGNGKFDFIKGTNTWNNTEIIDTGMEIGYTLNREGVRIPTSYLKLHYSKTGIHAVPYSGGLKNVHS